MPAKRTYTDEQLDYIKRYWRKYPTKLVAEQLGMTPARVNSIASRLRLTKNKNKARTPLPEFVVYKINKRPQVVELDMTDKDSMQFVVKTGNMCSGDIKVYGMTNEPQLKPLGIDIINFKPRKNWLQRLVSWFLTGEA